MRLRIEIGSMEIDLRSKEEKEADKKLWESIERSEKDIREGRSIILDAGLSAEEIREKLLAEG